jgi:hypothetical protein
MTTLHFHYLTYSIDKEVTLEEIMEAATEVWEVRRGGGEEEDENPGTFTRSKRRVPWEDRHYLSTSEHLF